MNPFDKLASGNGVGPALTFVVSTFVLAAACLRPPDTGAENAAGAGQAMQSGSGNSGSVPSIPYVWKSVVVSGGGFVTGLVFSAVKPGILYARTDIGGAYRYEPSKRSWVPLTDFVSRSDASFLGIESIATDPVNADRVYMAVGMYAQTWAGPGAFLRSDDRGESWRVTRMQSLKMGGNDLGRSNGERLAVDPHQPKILYFGSRLDGLWHSTDESATWNKLESFPVKSDPKGLGIPFVLFEPSGGKPGEATKVIYAGVSRARDNLYRSTDAGRSWQLVPQQPSGFLPSRAALDRDGSLYVSYGDDPGPFAVQNGALYRYEPGRDTWTDISPIKPTATDRFGFGAVTVDRSRPGTLLATTIDRWSTGGEIFRSTDRGKSWKPLMAKAVLDSAGVAHPYHHREKLDAPQWMGDIKIDPFAPDRALVIDGGGVWATEDLTQADKNERTHWSFLTSNLEETAVKALISPPEGAPLLSVMADLCGFVHDSLEHSPKRGNFRNPTCASGDSIDFAGAQPKVVARVGTYPWDDKTKLPRGAVSLDGGLEWTQFGSEPALSSGSGSIAVSADGNTILWAPKDAAAARSSDRGASWIAARGLPAPAKVPDWAPGSLRLAADRVNAKKFYAFDALTGRGYVSEDGGVSFDFSTDLTALPEYNLIVGSIQAVAGLEGHVWVTGGKELFRSDDSGHTYSDLPNVEESYAVGFGKAAPGQKYPAIYLSGKVSGVVGFFRSDDGGATFSRINDDAHQYGGSNLIIGDPRVYGRVYVAPGGRGILYGEPR